MSILRRFAATAAILILLGALAYSAAAAQMQGRIATISPETNEVVLSENLKHWRFELSKGARILLNDREATLAELRPGDEASVIFEREGRKLVANIVRCTRP